MQRWSENNQKIFLKHLLIFLFLFSRQFSKEQQDLKVALERQMAVNQNLSQEKEQLMFKLRHRDSCPGIHLPPMMQEIAPRWPWLHTILKAWLWILWPGLLLKVWDSDWTDNHLGSGLKCLEPHRNGSGQDVKNGTQFVLLAESLCSVLSHRLVDLRLRAHSA